MKLTDDELRRIRLAGNLARGMRYFILLVVVPAMLAIVGLAIYIQVNTPH